MVREAERIPAETAADKMASQIEDLDRQYRQACARAARSRSPEDNEQVEWLREQIARASKEFQALTTSL